ncbi:MAG TPA: ABC transporter substrate-binding protein, partial [Chloroflexota bacterium]|nr:ABC transporter substrate-binding protein [Chloroflexota bacterium]
SAASGQPVWYGVSGPFSGDNAEYGRIWKQAMAMALDEINGKGGVKGRQVQLDYEDTQSDPKQSVPVAQKFVDDTRLLAELGDFSSPSSMAASPIYERAKMVQFGFTNSHPDFTKGGEYMFSIVLTQQQDAAFLAETAFKGLGKKQAVLYQDTDWGKTTQQIYVDQIKALGGDVVHTDNYLATEKDFKPILAKVQAAKPDVLALISYYNDGALIVQQAKDMGLQTKVVANGACYSPQFLKLGGDATNGVVLTTVFFPNNPRPEVQQFVNNYNQRYKELPDQFAALAYDAVKIITWATNQGGFDRVAIQKAMATGTDIPSVIYGPFKFGADRRVENAKAVPIQVQNGKFVPYTPTAS